MINWKLRLKNKATLTALIGSVLAFAYQVCGIFGVVPPISQEQATQALGIVVNLLVTLGVLVDPTTKGVGDSSKALGDRRGGQRRPRRKGRRYRRGVRTEGG